MTRTRTSFIATLGVFCSIGAMPLVACNPSDAADLADAGPTPQVGVVVLQHESDGSTTRRELSPDAVAMALEDYCKSAFPNIAAPKVDSLNCEIEAAQSWRFVCAAHKSLELAQAVVGTDLHVNEAPQGTPRLWTFVPQPPPGQATLSRLAMRFSRAAIDAASDGVSDPTNSPARTNPCSDVQLAGFWGPSNATDHPIEIGSHLAAMLVEAYHVGREASDLDQRYTLAVADKEYSDQAQVTDGTRMAWTDPGFSRARAASSLVGGSSTLLGFSPRAAMAGDGGVATSGTAGSPASEGFCPVPHLGVGGTRAFDALRTAAMDPRDIVALDTVSADALISGSGLSAPTPPDVNPGLAERLSVMRADLGFVSPPTSAQFFAHAGFTADDLLAARTYMTDEITAFERNFVVRLSIARLPDGTSVPFPRFAATGSDAEVPPPEYYAARARWHDERGDYSTPMTALTFIYEPPLVAGLPPPTTAGTPFPSLSTIIEKATRTTATILGWDSNEMAFLPTAARRTLSQFLGDARSSNPGIAYACYSTDATVSVRLYGPYLSSGITIVRGKDGLTCATRGEVEGQPCMLSTYTIVPTLSADEDATATTDPTTIVRITASGFTHSVHVEFTDPALVIGSGMDSRPPLYFLVEPAPAGSRNPYIAVTGFTVDVPRTMPSDPGTPLFCDAYPVSSEIDSATGDALAPSASFCAFPHQTCAGIPYDQRIPLEDELTENGDQFESSWRHYLDLADTAAAQADDLGNQLIQAGLDLDVRAESAVDQLSQACGATINVNGLVDGMGTTATMGPCGPGGTCGMNYVCQDGTCVVDLVAVAQTQATSAQDASRLAACLGQSTSQDAVTLGTTPLCYWISSGVVCGGAGVGFPCPTPGTDAASCIHPPGVVARIARPLGIFAPTTPPDPGAPPVGSTDTVHAPCAEIAQLRARVAADPGAARDAVRGANDFWAAGHLSQVASRLSWNAYPGDFSAVLLDRGILAATGGPSGQTFSGWPCGAASFPVPCPMGATLYSEPGTESSLFCATEMCGVGVDGASPDRETLRVRRARFNDRLARAVYAARITTGHGLEGVGSVLYPRLQDQDEPPTFLGATDEDVTVRGDGRSVHRGQGGTLRLQAGGHPWDYSSKLSNARYYWLSGLHSGAGSSCSGIPNDAEWAFCPYDQPACVEVFTGAAPGGLQTDMPLANDCDDLFHSVGSAAQQWTWDYNMPLVVHEFSDSVDRGAVSGRGASAIVDALYSGLGASGPIEASRDTHGFGHTFLDFFQQLAVGSVPNPGGVRIGPAAGDGADLESLTRYWSHIGCGQGHNFTHGYPDDIRDPGICGLSTSLHCESNSGVGVDTDCFGAVGADNDSFDTLNDVDTNHDHVNFWYTFDGNRAFIGPQGLTATNLLDAVELMCAVDATASPTTGLTGDPPVIRTASDLPRASRWLQMQADKIIAANQLAILTDVPSSATTGLLALGASSSDPSLAGEFGRQVEELRAGLIELSDVQRLMTADIQTLSTQMSNISDSLREISDDGTIANLNLESTALNQYTDCVKAAADSAGFDFISDAAKAGSALAVCINAGAQIGLATAINGATHDKLSAQQHTDITNAQAAIDTAYSDLQGQSTRIRAAVERIKAALIGIQTTQRVGRRAMAKALFLDSDDAGTEYAVNTVMRRRLNTLNDRYQAAFRNAQRTSYIAKLAIEQRLGMRMETMTTPMTLLDEPPSRWHMDVCSMTGIDYAAIRTAGHVDGGVPMDAAVGPPMPGGTTTMNDNFAGEYIGDYVRKLRNVVESYSFDFPFQAGTDTSVISLRDEVFGDRIECNVTSPNLLLQAGHLDFFTVPSGAPGWVRDGCITGPIIGDNPDGGAPAGALPSCIRAAPLDVSPAGDDFPIRVGSAESGRVPGYLVTFGDPASVGPGSVTTAARLRQTVDLGPGTYRISWFERPMSSGMLMLPGPLEGHEVAVTTAYVPGHPVDLLAGALLTEEDIPRADGMTGITWHRWWAFFEIVAPVTVEVAIVPGYPGMIDGPRAVAVAAPMLELTSMTDVPTTSDLANDRGPGAFVDTDSTRARLMRACEDSDGVEFRRTAWRRNCLRLCRDGFGAMCDDATATQRCFWETKFAVTQDAIERGDLIHAGGFAYGNYNYRFESLGLNFVGTNVHDCSHSTSPSTCYASGTIGYSIIHEGPYIVRNHRGEDYDARLFTGVIETARGLAAERYLTNPTSGADSALITPFLRREFRGRPLDGNYILRVWDDGTVNWPALQDVQIVLNYRYWTRQH